MRLHIASHAEAEKMINRHETKTEQRRKTRKEIFMRDGGSCFWCGIQCRLIGPENGPFPDDMASLDHLIPKSQNGTWHFNNLVLSCSACNQLRDTIHPARFARIIKHARLMVLREIATDTQAAALCVTDQAVVAASSAFFEDADTVWSHRVQTALEVAAPLIIAEIAGRKMDRKRRR